MICVKKSMNLFKFVSPSFFLKLKSQSRNPSLFMMQHSTNGWGLGVEHYMRKILFNITEIHACLCYKMKRDYVNKKVHVKHAWNKYSIK